jgi:GxxExxY protein
VIDEKKHADRDLLSEAIIGRAIEVHRNLGPGLLESSYEECLAWELRKSGLSIARQVMIPIVYKEVSLAAAYRLDIVVEGKVLVEVKAVERIAIVHEAQLLTYLRHTRIPTGLLLNFNCAVLRDGIRRLSL